MTISANERKFMDELDAPPNWWNEAGPVDEDWQGYPLDFDGDGEDSLVTQPWKDLGGLHACKAAIIDLLKFVS